MSLFFTLNHLWQNLSFEMAEAMQRAVGLTVALDVGLAHQVPDLEYTAGSAVQERNWRQHGAKQNLTLKSSYRFSNRYVRADIVKL